MLGATAFVGSHIKVASILREKINQLKQRYDDLVKAAFKISDYILEVKNKRIFELEKELITKNALNQKLQNELDTEKVLNQTLENELDSEKKVTQSLSDRHILDESKIARLEKQIAHSSFFAAKKKRFYRKIKSTYFLS